ncbi:aldo-keto reductase [Penicillium alfredii]|uniref:Aldo-keto reductase n=1 Tax=Penicillium alfredii TaxID=1506179 RepID=A0A9W9F0I1_9EURO|nr:aldo-keto reductase [Penicillium alfredii]KAJ5091332.1 aldo-keto reductase [Penicillium alfredii]
MDLKSWILDEDKALPLLKTAFDRGVNTWDTSNNYSNGKPEEIIGKAIRHYQIPRQKLTLFTKCWAPASEHDNIFAVPFAEEMRQDKDYVNQFAIFNAVDVSLKRLGIEYIDLFQIHRFDPLTHREEEREMNRFCNEMGVGLIPWSPLEAGRLARPLSHIGVTARLENTSASDLFDADVTIIDRVGEVAKRRNWSISHVVLAWVTWRVASPIVGFSSVERIDDALEIGNLALTAEGEKYLEEPYVPKVVGGHD